jgi:flagellar biosynthetic protein FliR
VDITDAQLQSWVQGALFPLARIGGLLISAPVIGDKSSPGRVRLMLALGLTMVMAPLLPSTPPLAAFTAVWWLRMAQETLLGIMLGFVLKLVFEAVVLGGELIGNSMGLGFARMADPIRGADVPVIGQFLHLMATLLFLALGGHLRLIELLATSFTVAPDAGAVLGARTFEAMSNSGVMMFAAAVSLALPTMAALLLVNLAFGVMSRSAPTLNGLSVGFPLSLAAGMVLLRIDLPSLRHVFTNQLDQAWGFMSGMVGIGVTP